MLYCAGNGQELLSALGVTLVCHASTVFRVSKNAFVNKRCVFKINGVVVGQGLISSFRTLAAVLVFLKCSFFRVLKVFNLQLLTLLLPFLSD